MRLRVAAVQMTARLGAVETNLRAAEGLVREAFRAGAEWVVLPEFFPSAMAYHPSLHRAVRPVDGAPAELLKRLAREHGGPVGGSFMARRHRGIYNTFVLALPDGTVRMHDKDQPTMWENCYYAGGGDDGILTTPAGPVGAALCWELVRTRTARRLLGRVGLVLAGSCWWTLPDRRVPGFPPRLHRWNRRTLRETPGRFARLLGVPVVHAAHAGTFEARLPLAPGFPYRSAYLGETQIVDGSGGILARMDAAAGEGFVVAEVEVDPGGRPAAGIPDRFWIPHVPPAIRLVWGYQNLHGRIHHRRRMRRGPGGRCNLPWKVRARSTPA